MKGDHYSIYGYAKRAICPLCAGLLRSIGGTMDLCCADCAASFRLVGMGRDRMREMLYEQVGEGRSI